MHEGGGGVVWGMGWVNRMGVWVNRMGGGGGGGVSRMLQNYSN